MSDEEKKEDKIEDKKIIDPDDKDASDLITAAHNSAKELGIGIWKRFLELMIKLMGIKGLFFAVCTYLFLATDKVPLWLWATSGVMMIGGTYADLFIDKIVPKGRD